jgi:uncharacterized protein (DUF2062 family)/trans-aconitate methyltransferase
MRQRLKKRIAENIYAMRTTTTSPARRGSAVALGVLIGCSPLLGLHVVLAALLARALRLDMILVLVGVQVSYPVFAPFLFYFEMQAGAWVRTGEFREMSLGSLRALPSPEMWATIFSALGDLVVGSVVVGVALAALCGLATYAIAHRLRPDEFDRIADAAAEPYAAVSIFGWEWVRAKMRRDPVFFAVMRLGLLPQEGTLVDVGCGRGVLLALLSAAPRLHDEGRWPAAWPPPPRALELHGIEHHHHVAAVARAALAERATIETADASRTVLPAADAIAMFDVLHYLRDSAQRDLIRNAAAALRPGGMILVREADKDAGARYHATHAGERLMALLRGAWAQRFHFRSAAEWTGLFAAEGLTVEAVSMSDGTPFANVLLIARRAAAPRH